MAKKIEPQLRKIGEYLRLDGSAIFSIPKYQRSYSWDVVQCDKLWQDITAFMDSGGEDPYFFGTIIINCFDDDKILSLIDGQQRTTTFLLLLKALLIKLNAAIAKTSGDEDSEALEAGLKARRVSILKMLYKFDDEDIPNVLKSFDKAKGRVIIKNESINEQFKDEVANILSSIDFETAEKSVIKTPYKQKDNKYSLYFRNFKYFYGKLEELSPTEINKFAKTLLEKCEIIEIRSWNVAQAITMFNSLNSDGLPLNDADIISAELYSRATDNTEVFAEQWQNLRTEGSALEQYGIKNIDAILMQFMYVNRARKKSYINANGMPDVTTPGLRRYYTELPDGKPLLNEPLVFVGDLQNLTELWSAVKDYTEVKLLQKFNDNAKLYLAGFLSRYKASQFDSDEFAKIYANNVVRICECLIRLFTVLELVDAGYSSSKFKTFLFGENVKLVDRNITVEEIEEDFNRHISDSWERDDLEKAICDCNRNSLVYLNEFLFAKASNKPLRFADKCDVEHIMPASGDNIDSIRADAGFNALSEFESCVNQLGNKILLEERINRSLGNQWFRTKITSSIHKKNGYKDSRYPIASALVETYKEIDKPFWTKEDILRETKTASQRIVRYIFGCNE